MSGECLLSDVSLCTDTLTSRPRGHASIIMYGMYIYPPRPAGRCIFFCVQRVIDRLCHCHVGYQVYQDSRLSTRLRKGPLSADQPAPIGYGFNLPYDR